MVDIVMSLFLWFSWIFFIEGKGVIEIGIWKV